MTKHVFQVLTMVGSFVFALCLSAAGAGTLPHTWQRWEHTLTSARDQVNPYADTVLRVQYAGPDGRTFGGYGFWDGGRTFRIRCAFPTPGTWRWQTECSDAADAGLHRQRGAVEVQPYRGENPLYRHGFLRVSDDRRYLAHADGTPYLWMGDTAWAAPYRATDREWEAYIADRAAKHFSLIQVVTPPRWGPDDLHGEAPFSDDDLSQWNPAFWQAFERKVEHANAAGLMVFLVGLMEPVRRYPTSDRACLFARNIVARLFGNFMIFSPSFDSRPMPLGNEVGRATRDATAVHLITQHPGTGRDSPEPAYALYYADQPYLDFVGVQSGHNGGNRERCARQAIDWVLHMYRHEPCKPVINLEGMYDAQGERAWQAADVRGAGWRSWLSGSMGYTYGAGDTPPKVPKGGGGLWRWVNDPEKYDYWEKVLQWESSTQMKYLHDFFAAFDWWRLEPAHGLIRNQPEEAIRRMVLAVLPDRTRAVAYLPDNAAIKLDLSSFSEPLTVRWFNPVHGNTIPVSGRTAESGVQSFVPPTPGEWVLVLEQKP